MKYYLIMSNICLKTNKSNFFKNKKIIKEICIKLNLKIEMINDVFKYCDIFYENNSNNFSEEVLLGSCIYLSGKINEDFKRIRGDFQK